MSTKAETLAKWHEAMAAEPKRNEGKRKRHADTAAELRRLSAELADCKAAYESQFKALHALKASIGEPVAEVYRSHYGGRSNNIGFDDIRKLQCVELPTPGTPLYAIKDKQP